MLKQALVFMALAAPAAAQDAAMGEQVFLGYCAVCHGPEARGDGIMAEVMTVKPADLTQLSASNGGVFPTFRVVRQIDGRDPLLAHGGEMPLFGELFDMPDTAIASESGQPILTASPIADVVTYLQGIQELMTPKN